MPTIIPLLPSSGHFSPCRTYPESSTVIPSLTPTPFLPWALVLKTAAQSKLPRGPWEKAGKRRPSRSKTTLQSYRSSPIRARAQMALGVHGLHLGPSGSGEACLPWCPGLGLCGGSPMCRAQKIHPTRNPRPLGLPSAPEEMPSQAHTALLKISSCQCRRGGVQRHPTPGHAQRKCCRRVLRGRASLTEMQMEQKGRNEPGETARPHLTVPGPKNASFLCCHTGEGSL